MEKFTTVVGYFSFICVLVMMLMNVGDVLLNKLTNKNILGAYEITQRLLMCAVFASFAYAQSKKAHINMTIIIEKLPRVPRFVIFTLMSVLSVVAAGAMTWAAYLQTMDCFAKGYVTEVLYIPLWPFYVVEIIAMAIFTVTIIYDTVLYTIAIFRNDYAEMVQKEWT
ncbi:MAG: TRAP transporter small permease [Oscillospiraceae bacterium]|nr:TRAP transporter small permease [Oscillospiraceae bacterium]